MLDRSACHEGAGEADVQGTWPSKGDLAQSWVLLLPMQVPEPEFEGQTKTRLGNPEVRKIVDACVARVRCFICSMQTDERDVAACTTVRLHGRHRCCLTSGTCQLCLSARCGVLQGVTDALEGDSSTLSQILGKAMSAYRAAEAAKRARELVSLVLAAEPMASGLTSQGSARSILL